MQILATTLFAWGLKLSLQGANPVLKTVVVGSKELLVVPLNWCPWCNFIEHLEVHIAFPLNSLLGE